MTSTLKKTAQLSGLAQTGGYIFAALGPVCSVQANNSLTLGPCYFNSSCLDLIMGIALYKVENRRNFVSEKLIKENAPQVVACGVIFV
ncbi:MAG: hypothetical protein ACLTZB_01635 [Streptococcus salivarius]